MSGEGFEAWSREVAGRMEEVLAGLLPAPRIAPARLHDAMRYATLGGGKRVRAMLVFAAGELAGAEDRRLEVAAAAVEMIHAYSLIHDDLPCMDDDVLRRGKPTCHVEFDEATALLAGDALQGLGFQLLAEHRLSDDPLAQLHMIQLVATACGSRGMAGGQAIDLESVGRALTLPELEYMHILKTGALHPRVRAPRRALRRRPRRGRPRAAGPVRQVRRDSPSRSSTTSSTRRPIPPTLGKTAGKDRAAGKPTYMTLLGLPQAKALAAELLGEAREALDGLGERAGRLRELAEFIVERRR